MNESVIEGGRKIRRALFFEHTVPRMLCTISIGRELNAVIAHILTREKKRWARSQACQFSPHSPVLVNWMSLVSSLLPKREWRWKPRQPRCGTTRPLTQPILARAISKTRPFVDLVRLGRGGVQLDMAWPNRIPTIRQLWGSWIGDNSFRDSLFRKASSASTIICLEVFHQ